MSKPGTSVERLPGATIRGRWGRLLSEAAAAEYLGISRTTLRDLEIASKRLGRRVLYDIRTLDRFADQMGDGEPVPMAPGEASVAAAEQEQAFFARRNRSRG